MRERSIAAQGPLLLPAIASNMYACVCLVKTLLSKLCPQFNEFEWKKISQSYLSLFKLSPSVVV